MTEALSDIFSIILGRYFFGAIGAGVRFVWLRIRGKRVTYKQLWEDPKDSDDAYDKQAFKSRLVGFGFILALLLLAVG